LDQTDNPQKTFDTVATYKASNADGFKMETPTSDAGNDANIVIRFRATAFVPNGSSAIPSKR